MAQRLCPVIVGRESELLALASALDLVVAGNGQCVFLVGEPGIGKSRLAREVAGQAAARGLPTVAGRSVPASAATPYRPVAEALTQLFRRAALSADPGLERWLPLIRPLLPTVLEPESAAPEAPPSLRAEAVIQLLAGSVPAGVAIVLEDLHWADPDSVALVEYLADNISALPALVVVTLRDGAPSAALEVARRQRGRPGVVYLAPDRLGAEDLAEMVRACRPGAGPDLVARIADTSDGVPLLVEELLAAPGLPGDLAAAVQARLAALPPEQRAVIEAAAVLGRQFDWELLAATSGEGDETVGDALAAGVESLLLASQGSTVRFRHALTREAVLATVIPPKQRQLAARALETVTAAHGELSPEKRDLAVELAQRAGQLHRAGSLLAESGRQALALGALATAADALSRAAGLLAGHAERAGAELDLVEALALAGRVDEAAAAGGRLIRRLGSDPATTGVRLEAHLRLAHSAVAASRWQMARHHLDRAGLLTAGAGTPPNPRMVVLEADLAIAEDDYGTARDLAGGILGEETPPEVRCHAFEIVGRSWRSADLPAARAAFESALVTAEASDLPLWRLRALHELGTIDLFDHVGVERLLQARRAAEQMGALSTAAVLDLQLAAAYTCRWDLDACDGHAISAVEIAERLGLDQVRAKAFAMLTGSAGMRGDLASTERYASSAVAAGPEDRMLEGFCWGMRGMALLLMGDGEGALEPWSRGMAILAKLPHAEPASLRALWPLVLAARGDRRAVPAIDEARRLGVAGLRLNQAMIGYAEAVLHGRAGDARRARETREVADTGWTNCEAWADLSRLLAAPAAHGGGWADVGAWLTGAPERFDLNGLPALSSQCRQVLASATPNPWSDAGITGREADVLRLVAEGLANKEIAARLHLSPRTVEKHVESLLRKAGARSRTELVSRLGQSPGAAGRDPSPAGTT